MKGRDNNHGTKSFNFEFILNTNLEKHYEKLVDDEMIATKIENSLPISVANKYELLGILQ